jgi:hypothetical protein
LEEDPMTSGGGDDCRQRQQGRNDAKPSVHPSMGTPKWRHDMAGCVKRVMVVGSGKPVTLAFARGFR